MDHRSRLGATLLLTLVSLACGTGRGDKTFDRSPAVVPAPPVRHPLVRLARTGPCVGWCPLYSVEVYDDGVVAYSGVANVMTVGPAAGALAPDALAKLRVTMGRAGYAKMPTGRCACGCRNDTADVNLTTWKKDVPETVTYDEGCERAPHDIRVLEDEVDHLVGVEQWIGTHQQRRLCFEEQRDCTGLVGVPAPSERPGDRRPRRRPPAATPSLSSP